MPQDRRKTHQAMPRDGRKGAPDGVNTQGEIGPGAAIEEKKAQLAPGERKAAEDEAAYEGFLGHGGSSVMGYHGTGQLGDRKTRPGGNANAGARSADQVGKDRP